MTKLEIEAIRKRVEKAKDYGEGVGVIVFGDVPKLLAEIERLKNIIAWNVSCVVCVNQLGEGWKYDDNYGELICEECFENRYGGDGE